MSTEVYITSLTTITYFRFAKHFPIFELLFESNFQELGESKSPKDSDKTLRDHWKRRKLTKSLESNLQLTYMRATGTQSLKSQFVT